MSLGIWMKAARLRTLPLAIAGTLTGNLLALTEQGYLHQATFILSVLTAVFLQILSNYANDYGDFKNGADTAERTDRMMASGQISEQSMKRAISVLVIITLMLGISLLLISHAVSGSVFIAMLLLGIGGILAAYYYTGGKNPYGYKGFGDIAVFIFFGLVAVNGTYFLQTGTLSAGMWWIAMAVGLLSAGVLNVNNIRDMETDRIKGKHSIPVLLGYNQAVIYHASLLYSAFICLSLYVYFSFQHPLQLIYLILIPLFIKHFRDLKKARNKDRMAYNVQLKNLSLLTLFLCLVFCLGQLIIL